jgi:hypothetical protein
MDRHTSATWASGHTTGDPALDILVPTCKRPAELAVTLAGLASQDRPAFRLVVSDQSDGPPAWEHPPACSGSSLHKEQQLSSTDTCPAAALPNTASSHWNRPGRTRCCSLMTTYGWNRARWPR